MPYIHCKISYAAHPRTYSYSYLLTKCAALYKIKVVYINMTFLTYYCKVCMNFFCDV